MATLLLSRLLPSYFSPIIGLIAAAFLYTVLYNNRLRSNSSCPIVIYAIFFCIVAYSFVSIIINVLDIWSVVPIPKELSFFNEPYMCSLVLDPVTVIVLGIINLRGNKLSICVDCRITKGMAMERGKLGEILAIETRLQLRNLFWLFLIFSIAVWTYFFVWYYQNALVNNRDWYIFVWINIIGIALDLAYFASRYYNIYLDLQDSGEIITEAELSDMTTKTYLRFYAICGNKIFINPKVADPRRQGMFVIDTPLLTKRNVNGITTSEVHSIIKRMTGVDAKLRFFFGRKSLDIAKHRILRYFYFMDEVDGQPPKLDIDGEWVDFNVIKTIYNTKPAALSNTFLTDLSRMVTIILTQKLFDERGYRKMKVKSYVPTIDLKEIQEKDYDFQDDKWIRVAMYNSDQRGFYFKKWVNRFFGKEDKNKEGQIQRRR
ncbi:MAG: hypothetical protein K2M87_00485 [Muribaculaceae bacterium]|nr:hypothetical protein [Muribaculaceae bacterium]